MTTTSHIYKSHPLKPLHRECILELAKCRTQDESDRVLRQFNERRDAEYPGWRKAYEEQMQEYMKP